MADVFRTNVSNPTGRPQQPPSGWRAPNLLLSTLGGIPPAINNLARPVQPPPFPQPRVFNPPNLLLNALLIPPAVTSFYDSRQAFKPPFTQAVFDAPNLLLNTLLIPPGVGKATRLAPQLPPQQPLAFTPPNLLLNTLATSPLAPFSNSMWPSPQGPMHRTARSGQANRPEGIPGQSPSALPFNQYLWPEPAQPPRPKQSALLSATTDAWQNQIGKLLIPNVDLYYISYDDSGTQMPIALRRPPVHPGPNLLLTTLALPPAAAAPFVPVMWPSPKRPPFLRGITTEINGVPQFVPLSAAPFANLYWPSPYQRPPAKGLTETNLIAPPIQAAFPFNQYLWPAPIRPLFKGLTEYSLFRPPSAAAPFANVSWPSPQWPQRASGALVNAWALIYSLPVPPAVPGLGLSPQHPIKGRGLLEIGQPFALILPPEPPAPIPFQNLYIPNRGPFQIPDWSFERRELTLALPPIPQAPKVKPMRLFTYTPREVGHNKSLPITSSALILYSVNFRRLLPDAISVVAVSTSIELDERRSFIADDPLLPDRLFGAPYIQPDGMTISQWFREGITNAAYILKILATDSNGNIIPYDIWIPIHKHGVF